MKTSDFAVLPDLRKSIELNAKILATFDCENSAYNVVLGHLEKLLSLEMQIFSSEPVISPDQKTDMWYPDNGPWVEVPVDNMGIPAELGEDSRVQILFQHERENRKNRNFYSLSDYAYAWIWHARGGNQIVAYKIVNK